MISWPIGNEGFTVDFHNTKISPLDFRIKTWQQANQSHHSYSMFAERVKLIQCWDLVYTRNILCMFLMLDLPALGIWEHVYLYCTIMVCSGASGGVFLKMLKWKPELHCGAVAHSVLFRKRLLLISVGNAGRIIVMAAFVRIKFQIDWLTETFSFNSDHGLRFWWTTSLQNCQPGETGEFKMGIF